MSNTSAENSAAPRLIDRYRTLVEAFDDAVVECAPDGTVVHWDANATALTGFTPEQVHGRPLADLLGSEMVAHFFACLTRGNCGKGVVGTLLTRNAGPIAVRVAFAPFPRGSNAPESVFVVIRDLSDLMAAERELAQSRRQLAETEALSLVMRVHLALDGRFIVVPPRLCQLLGYGEDELLRLRFQDITHPDDLARDLELADELLRGRARTYEMEKRYLTRDGDTVWVYLNGSLVTDERGNPLYFIAFLHDISREKSAQYALRDSERRARLAAGELETLFAALPIPVWIAHDPQCAHLVGNREARRLLGMPDADNLSPTPPDGPRPAYRVRAHGRLLEPDELPMQRAIRQGEPVRRAELTIEVPGAAPVHLFGNAVPLRDDRGEVRGAVGAFLDISDRESYEQQLLSANDRLRRLNADLEQFTYATAHDLKAPLRAVANLAFTLADDFGARIGSDGTRRLRLLRERVLRMDALIQGLLEYSRLGATRRPPEPVALGPLLQRLLADLPLPDGFRVEVADSMPTIPANPLQVSQVFQNLIENAFRHHDRETGRIALSAERIGPFWRFSVADDGPGVPPAWREKVFQIFQTVRGESSGIGLSLVKKLVTEAGGDVQVVPNLPRGSVFRFTWPAQGGETAV